MSDENSSGELSKVEQDRQLLRDAHQRGPGATLLAYLKLSGPGWLQSALTLGGGSLASSLYLGVLAGVSMMWLQPIAMILGIVMLSAIGYVTMSTGERPFRAINQHINPVLGWSWLLASLAANMVWALPQYSLCYGVLEQNLMPGVLAGEGPLSGDNGKWAVSGVVLIISTMIVWSYGSGSWGVKLYEWMLKGVVAMIVACFFGVVIKMSGTEGGIDWGAVMAGFIPDPRQLTSPAASLQPLLDAIADPQIREYWTSFLVAKQQDVMISAAATAVGINMTFLLPYSMLARGWGKTFRGLAIFDLSTGMLIPFVLATSCVIIAAATQFHGQVPPSFTVTDDDIVPPEGPLQKAFAGTLKGREEAFSAPVTLPEKRLAAALSNRDAMDLAKALEPLTGSTVANVIFGIGVVGMTLSTISLLMLISGFVLCEVLNVPPVGWTHRIGCLAAATGALWPIIWTGDARFYLAIVTSVFGMVLLPIAYMTFFLMMNSRSLLGDEMPRGGKRVLWNVMMLLATAAALYASVYVVVTKMEAETGNIWTGIGILVGFGVLVAIGHFYRMANPADNQNR